MSFFTIKKGQSKAKVLAFSAIAIALAFVTSFIKLLPLPMGGSVTLCSMLFLALIGYWYGAGAGFTAALAYGLLQLLVDPYIISIPQMLLDYIFAFGALGCSGLLHKTKFKDNLFACYLLAVLGRFFFSFLSGRIFFATYMPEFFNSATLYSLAYNGSYLGLEALLTVLLLCLPPVRKILSYLRKLATE